MIINIADRCRPDGGSVRGALRRILGYRVSIGELIVVALVLGAIDSRPVLLIANVCMT